jgi:glutamine amidotransferase
MVGIIDYGVGNLFSLRSSFAAIGVEAFVSGDAAELARADRLILPGVGAFGDAAQKLRDSGLDTFVKEQAAAGKPLMGICLGMQLLFEKSYEYGEHEGLGLLKGQVVGMSGRLPAELKIPHMGWNALQLTKPAKLLEEGSYVYFVHSFYAENCEASVAAELVSLT